MVGPLAGVAVGALVALVTLTILRRRRLRDTQDLLDHYDDGAEAAGGVGLDVLPRLRRVVGRLVDSAADAERAAARLEMALDRVEDGVVVCDKDGRIVFTNAAGSVLVDARHEEALVAAAVAESLSAAIGGEAAVRSVELFGPPARTITVDAQPLEGDESAGAVATVADESRLRRLESVRSDFVANLSHELKTPIGGLALLAEALSETSDGAERERLAGRLLHESHRVGRVVDDLLALSEIEGDEAPRRTPVAVEDVVARVVTETAALAEGYGVDVEVSGPPGELWLTGDPVLLTSALGNLVENAVKYSGGASPVTVSVEEDGDFVRMTVEDKGIGIPGEDLDRVFERFYRVDRARSQATGGTGLGLALVRNIVRGHGGEVDLGSREGEGTTVVLRLPAAADDSTDLGPRATSADLRAGADRG